MPRVKSEQLKKISSMTSTKNVTTGETCKAQKTRKVRRFRPGTRAKMEVRKFQNNPKHNTRLLVPKAAMERLCREISQSEASGSIRFGKDALRALHVATEDFVTELFQKADKLRRHAKRKTLHTSDVHITNE